MIIVTLIYIALLVIFFVFAGLVLRHAVKFSYLSPRFKIVAIIFGLMAISIIIFSFYLLAQLNTGGTESISPSIPSSSGSSGLNF